jgi:hypothetical protein
MLIFKKKLKSVNVGCGVESTVKRKSLDEVKKFQIDNASPLMIKKKHILSESSINFLNQF